MPQAHATWYNTQHISSLTPSLRFVINYWLDRGDTEQMSNHTSCLILPSTTTFKVDLQMHFFLSFPFRSCWQLSFHGVKPQTLPSSSTPFFLSPYSNSSENPMSSTSQIHPGCNTCHRLHRDDAILSVSPWGTTPAA